jgi:hypothetical protein
MYTGAKFGVIAGFIAMVNIDSYCGIRIGIGSVSK